MTSSWVSRSKRLSLRFVLVVPFVVQLFIVVGLMGYLSFRTSQRAVENLAVQLQSEIAFRVQGHLRYFLNTPDWINQNNGNAIRLGTLDVNDSQALEHHFWHQVQVFETVTSIYFGNTEGGLVVGGREGAEGSLYVIATPGFKSGSFEKYATDDQGNRTELLNTVPNFDARKRPWYTRAIEQDRAVWSDIYLLFTSQDTAIAASRPVYDQQGDLLGVLSIDLFLSHIHNFLQNLQIGPNGHILVVERSGLLVASSINAKPFVCDDQAGKMRRLAAVESGEPMTEFAAQYLLQEFGDFYQIDKSQQLNFQMNGGRYFLQVMPFQDGRGLDWLIVIIVPESDFIQQINNDSLTLIMFCFGVLILATVVGFCTAQRVIRPISDLSTAAKAMAMGDWAQVVLVERKDELGELARSFNHMAEQLRASFANLTAKNTRLEQTNDALQHEIIERKRAEGEIMRLQHLLQNITDSMPSTLIALDTLGRVLLWNPSAEKMTDLAAGQACGQTLWEIYPDLARYRHLFEQVMSSGQSIRRHKDRLVLENRITFRDIGIFPLQANEIEGCVLRIDDVTRRVQLEEMMFQSVKMASIGGLAAGIAHEINNPLGAMMQSAQVLQVAFDVKHPITHKFLQASGVDLVNLDRYLKERELNVYFEGIRACGARAAKIVSDLLSFSRKGQMDVALYDLNALIQQTLDLAATDYDLKRSYDFRDIQVVYELASDLPHIFCDGQQIQQVVLNLVRNAVQAVAEKRDVGYAPRLTLRTLSRGDWVRLVVENNGPSIPEAVRERLFEPFFTTKQVGEGTGLGLWLCWSIVVERHKGRIWVESEGEDGVLFVVELPMIDPLDALPSGA